jgi:hypothetical protein
MPDVETVNNSIIGFDTTMQDEIVQIIDPHNGYYYDCPVQTVRIEILTGRYYKGGKYRYRLGTFKQCFKPYTNGEHY